IRSANHLKVRFIQQSLKDMEDSFNDHNEILGKIIANDIDGACCILKKHLERLEKIYLRDK
ncbi:hypothetical protein, partial [Klebsiella pneumoniae]